MRRLSALVWFVTRLAIAGDGDLDTSFGTKGYVVQAPANASLVGYAIAVQDDAKIVVGGTRWAFTLPAHQNQAAIWRFLPDGSPDRTFGNNGLVSLPFRADYPVVYAVALQRDGSILAGGSFGQFGTLRLHSDGSIDTGFGWYGVASVDFGDLGIQKGTVLGAAVDDQGRILLVGSGNVNGYPNWRDATVARLSPNGALDTGFGVSGRVVVQFGDSTTQLNAVFFSAATDAAGRVWLSGNGSPTQDASVHTRFLAARLDTNGNLDPSFGGTGIVTASFGTTSDNRGAQSALQGNRLTIGGTCDSVSNPSFCLLRLLEDGSADPNFGNSGWADISVAGGLFPNSSMACQPDSRCMVFGSGASSSSALRQYIVARVDAAGLLDGTFGNDGVARIDVPASGDGSHIQGRAIALQSGQPILVGTTDGVSSVYGLFATRLLTTADEIFNSRFD